MADGGDVGEVGEAGFDQTLPSSSELRPATAPGSTTPPTPAKSAPQLEVEPLSPLARSAEPAHEAAIHGLCDPRREALLHDLQRREIRCLGHEVDLRSRKAAVERQERAARGEGATVSDVEAVRFMLSELLISDGVAGTVPQSEGVAEKLRDMSVVELAERIPVLLKVLRGDLVVNRPAERKYSAGSGVERFSSGVTEDFFSAEAPAVGTPQSPTSPISLSAGSDPAAAPEARFDGLRTDEVGDVGQPQALKQGNLCAQCRCPFHSGRGRLTQAGPRPCHYTGEMYCRKCHSNRKHALPSRILRRWEFTSDRVSDAAYKHLSTLWDKPILRIDAVNPQLYYRLSRLRQARRVRNQIVTIHRALAPLPPDLEEELRPHAVLLEDADVYSMQDLVSIGARPGQYIGRLREVLGKLVRYSEASGGPPLEHLPLPADL
eukprot:TRINITY_DN40021_c0_g1_i1.p1 TRINITY_DN40021_c0_g1~~TRINITY_DN40021_c0_g1_i1.p1  ORF type:complete len:451 (+),score=58.86 TRINITY_DN40021_c0_g1_i1:54-1355(+)